VGEVRFENVRKVFDGDAVAVDRLDLTVTDGELLVLVGPSGCGKTTALRMVAGLETPTEGTIWIGDRAVNDVSPANRDIAMVFQNYALYPHMTVERNIAFPLERRRVPKDERRRRVAEVAEMLDLTALLQRKPSQLSGGQRQRVAMGRALSREPAAFLLDEPLSNLDAKLRMELRAELKQLHGRVGTTMIYVTHDQVEAMTLGERIAVMDHGLLQQLGRPTEIYAEPANLFVATFIGSPPMNLLTPADAGLTDLPRLDLTVGLRPEALSPAGDDAAHAVEITVDLVEPLGNETVVHGSLAGGGKVIARLSPRVVPSPGDRMRLAFDRADVHVFDVASGDRVSP
jgi:ABC-type sugar transport system ATPase subunit